jgi:hypothetical protein
MSGDYNFGARFAPQRLRPFRDVSLGVSPQIQRGWRTAALVSISDLSSDHVRPRSADRRVADFLGAGVHEGKGIENPKAEEAAY